MRRWKILIEVGGTDEQSDSPPAPQSAHLVSPDNRRTAWDKLVEGRKRLVEAASKGDERKAEDGAQWLGGALVTLAIMTGEDVEDLRKSLREAVPSRPLEKKGPTYGDSNLVIDTDYVPPKLPPGAPRKLDISELSDDEKERLGIIEPKGDVNEDGAEDNEQPR